MSAPRGIWSFFSLLPKRWLNTRRQARDPSGDFSHEVYESMAGCLGCKACAGQCPVKVSVPEFRSRFLELYHTRYLRPFRDYLIGSLETTVPYVARFPSMYNALMDSSLVRRLLKNCVGMVDSPLISYFDLASLLTRLRVRTATPSLMASLTETQRARSVILVPDAFTRWFDTPVWAAFIELAVRTGHIVFVAPYFPNGKPLHVQGFLPAFEKVANRHAKSLSDLARSGIPLVGLDPAMTLVFRQEYPKVLGEGRCPAVLLPQEWLIHAMPEVSAKRTQRFEILAHCTEKTNAPSSTALWSKVFEKSGIDLEVLASGCCGMAGTYGHEARHYETTKTIYDLSWRKLVDRTDTDNSVELLADGYSCRCQVKRFSDVRLKHPIEVLLDALGEPRVTQ